MKNLIFAFVFLFADIAAAITPPVISQSKPGIISFSWAMPTTRTDGSALAVSELKECRLYLTSEPNFIAVGAPAISFDYIVPIGYITKSTDSAAMTCVDIEGNEGPASLAIQLPAGITTKKSPPGVATSLKSVVK